MDKERRALELWRQLLYDEPGGNLRDPYYEAGDGYLYCFFCGAFDLEPDGHDDDCTYVAAVALIEEGNDDKNEYTKGELVFGSRLFTERELALIKNCVAYADNEPAGLPGHNLMLVVAKMADELGYREWAEGNDAST